MRLLQVWLQDSWGLLRVGYKSSPSSPPTLWSCMSLGVPMAEAWDPWTVSVSPSPCPTPGPGNGESTVPLSVGLKGDDAPTKL